MLVLRASFWSLLRIQTCLLIKVMLVHNRILTLKVPITTGRRHFQSMFFVFFRGNNA